MKSVVKPCQPKVGHGNWVLDLTIVILIIIKKLSMGAGEMFSHLSWELMNDINVSYCFYLRCFYATYLILT